MESLAKIRNSKINISGTLTWTKITNALPVPAIVKKEPQTMYNRILMGKFPINGGR